MMSNKLLTENTPYTIAVIVVCGTAAFFALRTQRKKQSTIQTISIDSVEEHTVRNHATREEIREQVSEVDQWLSQSSSWLPFCLRFDDALDVSQVLAGLERTLEHIPALGARFDSMSNRTLYELVLSPENNGVPLEFLSGKCTDRSYLPDESSPRTVWKTAGLDAPPPGFQGAPGPADPLMRAKLIVFSEEQVSYLSIGISHGLGDGHSVQDIMQIWSHFCTADSSADQLPEGLRAPREFGRRITRPLRPAKSIAELEERVASDVGSPVNPLSAWAFFGHVLPRAIWSISQQRVLDVRIHADRIATLKATLDLPEGEWVSRFELVCASLMLAQRVSSTASSTSGQHKLFVACDLRGRCRRFSNDYFGNAAFDFCELIELPTESTWNRSTLALFAMEVHRGLRHGLENPEDITKAKDWFEAARHLGLTNKYGVWPIVFDTFKGSGTFVNSWGKRWLDVSMGANRNARCMVAYFDVAKNLLVETPRERSSGDSTVWLPLARRDASQFVKLCEDHADDPMFPFSVVT